MCFLAENNDEQTLFFPGPAPSNAKQKKTLSRKRNCNAFSKIRRGHAPRNIQTGPNRARSQAPSSASPHASVHRPPRGRQRQGAANVSLPSRFCCQRTNKAINSQSPAVSGAPGSSCSAEHQIPAQTEKGMCANRGKQVFSFDPSGVERDVGPTPGSVNLHFYFFSARPVPAPEPGREPRDPNRQRRRRGEPRQSADRRHISISFLHFRRGPRRRADNRAPA